MTTALGIPSRYAFFALAAMSVMMFSIDATIVAVALPSMMRDLGTSLALIGWTLTAYQLAQTVMFPLAGKLADNFGRTRVFLGCVVVFTLGSLLCGVAPNIYLLIVFRVVQALGGGGIMPSAIGIIAEEFPDTRPRMIGLFMSIFPLGGIIGPNLGGFIVEHWSWRECFLVNIPLGALVVLALMRRLRQAEQTDRRPLDFVGAGIFAAAIVALLSALTFQGQDAGYWRTAPFWALLGVSAAALAAFIWYERRAVDPVIDPRLVGRHPFLAVNLYNFCYGACVWGFFSFIPYYAGLQFGMSALESGAVLTPRSLAMMSTSIASSFLLMRYGYRVPMIAGCLLTVATLLMLSRGWAGLELYGLQVGPFWLLGAQIALGGVGMGLSGPASNNAALDLVPGRAATVSGIRTFFRSSGGIIGTAVIVLVLELSPDRAAGLRQIFAVMGVLLIATIPLVMIIPDTGRDRALARRRVSPTGGAPRPSVGLAGPSTGGEAQ
ncbi:MAG TPA: MFS transporter [Chloroflexota bacterium]